MAITSMGTANALTVKLWSVKGFNDMYKNSVFGHMARRGTLTRAEELDRAEAGDEVTVNFTGILTGTPNEGDAGDSITVMLSVSDSTGLADTLSTTNVHLNSYQAGGHVETIKMMLLKYAKKTVTFLHNKVKSFVPYLCHLGVKTNQNK